MQDGTIQYNIITVQYNKIKHITQNNIQHSNLQMWSRAVYECATQGVPNIRVLLYEQLRAQHAGSTRARLSKFTSLREL
jgi:hypothetical protein